MTKIPFKILLLVFFILLSFVVSKVFDLKSLVNIELFRSIFLGHAVIGAILFTLIFTLGNLLQIPGLLFLTGAVLVLGRINGYLLTLGAAIVSCSVCYFVIQLIGRNAFREIKYEWVKKLLKYADERPILVNTSLRLVFQTAPFANYILSLSGFKFRDYFLGIIIGLPLPILLYTVFIDKFFHLIQ